MRMLHTQPIYCSTISNIHVHATHMTYISDMTGHADRLGVHHRRHRHHVRDDALDDTAAGQPPARAEEGLGIITITTSINYEQ